MKLLIPVILREWRRLLIAYISDPFYWLEWLSIAFEILKGEFNERWQKERKEKKKDPSYTVSLKPSGFWLSTPSPFYPACMHPYSLPTLVTLKDTNQVISVLTPFHILPPWPEELPFTTWQILLCSVQMPPPPTALSCPLSLWAPMLHLKRTHLGPLTCRLMQRRQDPRGLWNISWFVNAGPLFRYVISCVQVTPWTWRERVLLPRLALTGTVLWHGSRGTRVLDKQSAHGMGDSRGQDRRVSSTYFLGVTPQKSCLGEKEEKWRAEGSGIGRYDEGKRTTWRV